MNERPILFNGAMVRAILAGTKTKTRRVIKPQPEQSGVVWTHPKVLGLWVETEAMAQDILESEDFLCPYGYAYGDGTGDRLWVRETWGAVSPDEEERPIEQCRIEYRADTDHDAPGDWHLVDKSERPETARWRPSIHMPRWASRITLELTDVRAQRLQEISDEDAIAEGVSKRYRTPAWQPGEAIKQYSELWDSINAKRGYSWESNPFVWQLTFKVVKP